MVDYVSFIASLKCKQCNKSLQPGQFSENNGYIYCKPCYGSVIGLKGYTASSARVGLALLLAQQLTPSSTLQLRFR